METGGNNQRPAGTPKTSEAGGCIDILISPEGCQKTSVLCPYSPASISATLLAVFPVSVAHFSMVSGPRGPK